MKVNHPLTPFTLMEKFNFVLDKLAEDQRNANLDEAIISWCIELSLENEFPQVSREIIRNKSDWIQNNTVFNKALELYRSLLVITDKRTTKGFGNFLSRFDNISRTDFYYNITETKKDMSIKSVLFIAFVLTGVGLLLYLLNKKGSNLNLKSQSQTANYSNCVPPSREKHILALLIKSDRYQDLIHLLKNNSYLQPEDSSKLYGATQGLWIGVKSKFDNSKIKQELNNCNPVTTTSEYDVHFVTITLNENDSRFHPDVNPMDRRDAFIELGKRSPQVTVSPRLSCKAYENTEFYNR